MKCRPYGVLLAIACLLPLTQQARGQAFGRIDDIQSEGSSYHVFASPGEATIQIVVLGTLDAGIYEVGVDTDLGQLLALTGAALDTRVQGERRSVYLRLYRPEPNTKRRSLIYEAELEDFLTNTEPYPVLQEGDVFTFEEEIRPRFKWQNIFSLVTSVATFILAVDRLSNK